MSFAEHALDLVDAVYAAAVDPSGWDDALRLLARSLDGTAAGLHVERDGVAVTQRWVGLEDTFNQRYRETYRYVDPWAVGWRSLRAGQISWADQLAHRAEVERSAFYNELCRPFEVDDMLGAALENDAGSRAFAFVVGGPRRGFDGDDGHALAPLVPHLRRALEIGERLHTFPLDQPPSLEGELRRRYALTPAEARVALHVGRGVAPKVAAAAIGSSWNTVRFQLRQIYAKTKTSGQSELARLIARLEGG